MKPLLSVLLPIVLLSGFASVVSAATVTPSAAAQASTAAQTDTTRLAAIKAKGDSDIEVRIASLASLQTKVTAAKRLTADQKSSLATELQGQVKDLTTLKAQLDAETTVDAARADFQKIFTEHYVYAFFLPRTERIVAADNELDASANLDSIVAKLQAYITQAKGQGKDVSALQAQLDDMKAKETDAATQAQSVITALVPLTAAGYPGNKTAVQAAATSLKTGRSDLETARKDAKALVASLKQLLGTSVQ